MLGGLTPDGKITLSHPALFNAKTALPGITLVLLKGPGPLPGDIALGASGLYWSSRSRMLLENLGNSHSSDPRTTVGKVHVEEKLVEILNANGESALQRVRDEARVLQHQLNTPYEFAVLDALIGALLGGDAKGILTTRAGVLAANGTPVDSERLYRFRLLADYLRTTPVPNFPDVAAQEPARTHFAVLESYFSNFVEGIQFSIEEAKDIVLQNKIVPHRFEDSHDVLSVFNLILHPHYRSNLPASNDILEKIRECHRLMMLRRPEAMPGEFKKESNFAGLTQFVSPGFVPGTLLEGVTLASSVPGGLARAIYYAFLVAEIHPFRDGNGRLSRLFMNAELSRCGRSRILIPTLYHAQYLDALRALTRRNDPEPLVRAIGHIADWTTLFDYQDLKQVVQAMKAAHAFEENLREFRLLTPTGAVFA